VAIVVGQLDPPVGDPLSISSRELGNYLLGRARRARSVQRAGRRDTAHVADRESIRGLLFLLVVSAYRAARSAVLGTDH